MPVSVADVLGATQYRSMSRAGRMTESLTSKSRGAFHAKVSKKQLADEEPPAASASGGGEGGKKKGGGMAMLKLLSVAEVAGVDSTAVDKRMRAHLPLELVDERVDPLCSSGRDHPEVKAKAEMIVTLEKEIAFHQALEEFHGGVTTAASRQSAEAVSIERTRRDREEAARRAAALGLAGTHSNSATTGGGKATTATAAATADPGSPASQQLVPSLSMVSRAGGAATATKAPPLSPSSLTRAATPNGGGGGSPSAAARASPAFAAKGDRFATLQRDVDRAPPVGHYRPRFTVVETSSPRSRFSKDKRVLNPTMAAAYIGDTMSPEERALAEAAAASPSRRPGTMASLNATMSNGGFGSFGSPGSPLGMSVQVAGAQMSPSSALGASALAVSSTTRGRVSSPSFANRGRDAPVMTRGASTPAPGQSRKSTSPRYNNSSSGVRSTTPGVPNDAALKPRGPSAALDFSRQLGRDERDRRHNHQASTSSSIPDTAMMPLRDGSRLHARGTGAATLSFDGYASREQAQRPRERRPEDESQRYYDRSAIDATKYTRSPTVDFGRSPSRAQQRSGLTSSPTASSETHLVAGEPPEKPRPHSPVFDMDKAAPRPPIELRQLDLQYDADDSPTRRVPQSVSIGAFTGRDPSMSPSRSRVPKPADAPRYLPSHEELDSPSIRRKLARSIDFGKCVDRERAAHVTGSPGTSKADEPAPIPAERLERAHEYLRPNQRGDPRIASHISRDKREAVSAAPPLTSAVDYSVSGDAANKPNLRLGYVSMGRMTERDRHTGNHFANESRTVSRLFDKSPSRSQTQQQQRGGDDSRSRSRQRSPPAAAA
jgi:hypothetical protein